ncbi:MAG: sarcosine oxidase subunit gamma family protein [Pseudomonadota bacterium]
MSDLASALSGAVYEGAARIEEAGLRGMITLKGDLGAAKLKAAVRAVTGCDLPGQRGVEVAGTRGLCWMAPDELLVLVPYTGVAETLAALDQGLKGLHYLAENVSDARAVFVVSGDGAREVLAKLSPADLRPATFGPGEMRRTRLAQVAAAFWMREDGAFEIICFRSVAGYVFNLLSNAAEPGTLPGHF